MTLTFNQWMRQVDRLLEASLGLSSMDLRDLCWRDMFDDERSPGDATDDIIADPYNYI